jgi:ElaB/YqjD/DUF883 family membrane-anchored ribosome-binding protein
MAAIARALARTFRSPSANDNPFKTIAIFCGLGLLASLLLIASYGTDLSSGFF